MTLDRLGFQEAFLMDNEELDKIIEDNKDDLEYVQRLKDMKALNDVMHRLSKR